MAVRRGVSLFLVLTLAVATAQAGTSAVSAGGWHSLALHADGTVRSWGDDSAGALGIGRSLVSSSPTVVAGLSGVTAVAAGGNRTVALKADGTVWSWGSNDYGELGDGTTTPRSTPVQAVGLSGIRQIAAGRFHTVALKSDGTVWTWGSNNYGELGAQGGSGVTARPVSGMSGVVEIAAGGYHTIARKSDGTLWAWGANDRGQLGDGAPTPDYTGRSTPVQVIGLTDVEQISGGAAHTVARKADGSVWAWGSNHGGALGDGTTIDRSTPVRVIGLSGVAVDISAGAIYTLARKNDGTVWAWGSDDYGEIDGSYVDHLAAIQLGGLTGAKQIAAGFLHSVAVRSDSGLWAWGANGNGQLGDGTTNSSPAPIQVPGLTGVRAAAVGGFHTVALRLDGTVLTWGDNSVGQLGNAVFTFRTTPASVEGLPQVTAVAGSLYQSFALTADGSVFAWGNNLANQFQDDSVGHSTPQRLSGLSNVARISAGAFHSVALLSDGSVRAWGSNYRGRLGVGGDFSTSDVVVVSGLSGVRRVSGGGGHTLAVKSDGTVWAWGENDAGQLGDGTTTDRYAPVQVASITNAVEVAAGPSHSLALLSDGTLLAWGRDYEGQLGDGGASPSRTTPVRVPGLSRVSAIAAGRDFSLALVDGNVWAWGVNYNGGIGCPDCDGRAGPLQVPGLARIAAIATLVGHVLALRDDGSIYSWGAGTLGQLGDGTLVDRESPVTVLRVGGGGSIAANDWFLDLDPAIPSTIPADKIPVFLVAAAKAGSGIEANIRFRAQDVGTPIFVFGYAPATLFSAAKDGPQCVLVQLSGGQLTQVSASSLQAYVSGVTTTAGQAVTVLSNLSTTSLGGATFCVGSASTSTQSVSAANNMCIVTVPAATGAPSCEAPASGTATGQPSYEGLWLKGDESGWGVNLTHQGTTLFATWFTYDTDGTGMWLVASSVAQTSAGNFSGTLYRTVGPAFSANPFNSIGFPANYTQVGTLTFSFMDANTGTMSYTVNGVTQSKAITRYIYASGGTNCTLGGTQGTSPNYQDLWLRSSGGTTEAGWGVNITHQGDILFATWFTYLAGSSSTNKGMWLVMSNGNKTAPGVYTGALQTTMGPAFSAVPFNPTSVVRTTVGSATFSFTDADNGTFSYTVNGLTQSKPIARYVYASPTTVCR